jgi:CubicO group peptidase (beta-lactamase class C family)
MKASAVDQQIKKQTPFPSRWAGLASRGVVLILAAAFALLGLQLTQASATEHSVSSASGSNIAAIDRYVQKEMEAARLPGMSLGVVKGDEIIYLKGFGEADDSGREVTPQTPFLIASLTKSFTALAVMQLAEEGKVDLDAPVHRYVPWFQVADPEASAKITVRQLLNHTSGLPSLSEGEYEMLAGPPAKDDLENTVRGLRTVQLTSPPGEVFQYSNVGYATLALVVQTVSGEPYGEYLEQHVYGPLRMHNSFVSQWEAQMSGMATGYRYWFGVPMAYDWSYSHAELGAGFTISSAEDLAHYLIAQLNGGRYRGTQILSPEGIAEMHRPNVPSRVSPYPIEESYGMGWFVREYASGLRTVEHAGDAPNFHADVVMVPGEQLGVVLLANGRNGLQPARISTIAIGVTNLLVGREPPSSAQIDSTLTILKGVLVGDAVMTIGIIWSFVALRRWRAHPERRPQGWFRVGIRVVPAFVLNLLWGAICLIGLPLLLRWPLAGMLLEVPDLGYALVLSGAVAIGWGILKPVQMFLALRGREESRDTDASEKAAIPVRT